MGRNWHEGGAVGPEDGWVDGGHSSGSGWVGPEMGGGIGSGTSFGLFPASHRHSFVHLLFFCNLPQAHQLGNQENVWRSTHVPGQLVSQCNAILVYVATGFAGIPKISKRKNTSCPSVYPPGTSMILSIPLFTHVFSSKCQHLTKVFLFWCGLLSLKIDA